ncbi:uncharacterized protein WM294_007296 [Sarcoramphus papa]
MEPAAAAPAPRRSAAGRAGPGGILLVAGCKAGPAAEGHLKSTQRHRFFVTFTAPIINLCVGKRVLPRRPLVSTEGAEELSVTVGVVKGGSYQPRNEDQSLVIQLKLLLKKQALPMVRQNRSNSEACKMNRRLLPIARHLRIRDKMR